VVPIPQLGISNALRSALHGWSKTLATEVGGDGVTVNILVPGRIATARTAALDGARAEREGQPVAAVAAQSRARIPVGRYGRPEEYGDAAAFLAGDRASYITGSVLRIDGGMIGAA
jgi:3-oxoacyl-[acyl-carrier protein] reductase